jgi:hypothetical protein
MAADRDPAPIAIWRTRLRWRLAGAWQWPAFFLLTAVDTVVLARLPFSGGRSSLLGSLLAAGLLNIIVLAVVPRPGGWLLRRRRPDLPREVASDLAGAIGLVALSLVFVIGGLAHRPALQREDTTFTTAITQARTYAAHHAPSRYLPLHGEDTVRQGPDLFRTCYAGPDPRRDYCLFIRTDEAVPITRVDPDQRPNATVSGPSNPGRYRG